MKKKRKRNVIHIGSIATSRDVKTNASSSDEINFAITRFVTHTTRTQRPTDLRSRGPAQPKWAGSQRDSRYDNQEEHVTHIAVSQFSLESEYSEPRFAHQTEWRYMNPDNNETTTERQISTSIPVHCRLRQHTHARTHSASPQVIKRLSTSICDSLKSGNEKETAQTKVAN